MIYHLKNEHVELAVADAGAELVSIKKDGKEYLWNADPAFWGRHAPVLFPQVGTVKDGRFLYEGKEYPMGQHGFARDEVFTLIDQTEDKLVFSLADSEETYSKYPFHFELILEYELKGNEITARWIVRNTDQKQLPFSIGGHPAFLCPKEGRGEWSSHRIRLTKEGLPLSEIEIHSLEGGVVKRETTSMKIEDGCLIPSIELFANDALILEGEQADRAALIDEEGNAYLEVDFVCPVLGIWAPVGKEAPFVCIEPWFGRADGQDFEGEITEREYGNLLEPGEVFTREYKIRLL